MCTRSLALSPTTQIFPTEITRTCSSGASLQLSVDGWMVRLCISFLLRASNHLSVGGAGGRCAFLTDPEVTALIGTTRLLAVAKQHAVLAYAIDRHAHDRQRHLAEKIAKVRVGMQILLEALKITAHRKFRHRFASALLW